LISKASPREWAGSVETIKVLNPESASFIAMAELDVVFPTPPINQIRNTILI